MQRTDVVGIDWKHVLHVRDAFVYLETYFLVVPHAFLHFGTETCLVWPGSR